MAASGSDTTTIELLVSQLSLKYNEEITLVILLDIFTRWGTFTSRNNQLNYEDSS